MVEHAGQTGSGAQRDPVGLAAVTPSIEHGEVDVLVTVGPRLTRHQASCELLQRGSLHSVQIVIVSEGGLQT